VSQHLEEALTRRFGLEWTARDDGHGFEIMGISGEVMRVFSSRRASITADLRMRAARFEQRYGRTPSQRELAQLAQASNFRTRAAKKEGALDFRTVARGLGGQARAHHWREPCRLSRHRYGTTEPAAPPRRRAAQTPRR
jgi:TrwC relaxase